MSPLLQLLIGAKGALAVVAGGLFVILVSVLRALRHRRDSEERANKLLFLALGGKADQARIQARSEGRWVQPLLEALGGELVPPSPRPLIGELLTLAFMFVAPCVLVLHGLASLHRKDTGDKSAAAVALLLGMGMLLPLATLASALVVQLGRGSARVLRGQCIQLLAKTVKANADQDTGDLARRNKDPRGE